MSGDDLVRRWGALVLWGPFRPIDAADLDRVEEAIGSPLPVEYRRFMEVAHGGKLEYAVQLPPSDPNGELIGFSDLFDVTGEAPGSLVHGWRSHPSEHLAELLPASLLPVAQDGGGSTLYLDLRPDTHGEVWAYVHGLPGWAGGTDQDAGGRVAASWQHYLDQLVVDEDLAEVIWGDAVDAADPGWSSSVAAWLDAGFPTWRTQDWATGAPDGDRRPGVRRRP